VSNPAARPVLLGIKVTVHVIDNCQIAKNALPTQFRQAMGGGWDTFSLLVRVEK